MKAQHKEFIANEIKVLKQHQSQKKLATRAGVSPATITQIVKGNWELIKDELWLKVKAKLNIDWAWQLAPTDNLTIFYNLVKTAQEQSESICISDKSGVGKTTAFKHYQNTNAKVILIECKNYWSKKSFARHQLLACGLDDSGTTEEMIEAFENHLYKLKGAVVIYDQFDKLKEPQKDLFMDYYNELDSHCGFVLSGVKALKIQETKGCRRDKMGYRERFSRYGSKFIQGNPISKKDVTKICESNGVTNKEVISDIYEDCYGDLRRVKRLIKAYFIEQKEIHA